MIARLRALLVEATPGPWLEREQWLYSPVLPEWDSEVVGGFRTAYDGELIAAMHAALPALLDAAEERDRLAKRERHYAEALRVADGGLYQNDWDAAIQRVVAERDAAVARAEQAERALLTHGYRRSCDIAACNCGDQWLHGGHAQRRLAEVAEELDAVREEATDYARAATDAAERLAEVEAVARELLGYLPRGYQFDDLHRRARAVLGRESDGE